LEPQENLQDRLESMAQQEQSLEAESLPVLFQSAVDTHTRLLSMSALADDYKVGRRGAGVVSAVFVVCCALRS
jgi:hypothetical protein